jgi:hypothetical protein
MTLVNLLRAERGAACEPAGPPTRARPPHRSGEGWS